MLITEKDITTQNIQLISINGGDGSGEPPF